MIPRNRRICFSIAERTFHVHNWRMQIVITINIVDPPQNPIMRFRNYYECSIDGTKWHDEWTCACNDRCPICDTETEPHLGEDVEAVSR